MNNEDFNSFKYENTTPGVLDEYTQRSIYTRFLDRDIEDYLGFIDNDVEQLIMQERIK